MHKAVRAQCTKRCAPSCAMVHTQPLWERTEVGAGEVSCSSSSACARCTEAPTLSAVSTASCQSTELSRCGASTDFALHALMYSSAPSRQTAAKTSAYKGNIARPRSVQQTGAMTGCSIAR